MPKIEGQSFFYISVTFFLSGALSLMVISLNRLCGIVFPNVQWLRLKRKTVIAILVGIWIVSVAFAGPTSFYRRYYVRTKFNCDMKNRHLIAGNI